MNKYFKLIFILKINNTQLTINLHLTITYTKCVSHERVHASLDENKQNITTYNIAI